MPFRNSSFGNGHDVSVSSFIQRGIEQLVKPLPVQYRRRALRRSKVDGNINEPYANVCHASQRKTVQVHIRADLQRYLLTQNAPTNDVGEVHADADTSLELEWVVVD